MITFQREKVWELWDEVIPLLIEHWKEIAHYKDITLDPDIEAYNAMEESGVLRMYTARRQSIDLLKGELIGYTAFFVRNNAHYRQSKQAVQDVLFLRDRDRLGFTGIKLIKFAEESLRDEGVQVIYHHVKIRHDVLGRLLERFGYEPVDVIYTKRLDHGRDSSDHRIGGIGRGDNKQCSIQQVEKTNVASSPAADPGP